MDSLTRSLALEWGAYGVCVNGIAPGPTGGTAGLLQILLPGWPFTRGISALFSLCSAQAPHPVGVRGYSQELWATHSRWLPCCHTQLHSCSEGDPAPLLGKQDLLAEGVLPGCSRGF